MILPGYRFGKIIVPLSIWGPSGDNITAYTTQIFLKHEPFGSTPMAFELPQGEPRSVGFWRRSGICLMFLGQTSTKKGPGKGKPPEFMQL